MDKLLQWLNTKVNHYNESNNKENQSEDEQENLSKSPPENM